MRVAEDGWQLLDIVYRSFRTFAVFPLHRRRVGNRYVYYTTPLNLSTTLPTISKYGTKEAFKKWFVMFSVLELVLTAGALYIINDLYQQEGSLFNNISNLYVLLVDPYISGTATLIVLLTRRHSLLATFMMITDADCVLVNIGVKPPYSILTHLARIICTIIPLSQVAWAIHMYLLHDLQYLLWRTCFAPCYLLYNYYMMFFVGIQILLYQRFHSINKKLSGMLESDCQAICHLILPVKQVHFQLCQISRKFSKIGNVPIILLTLKVYLTTIVCVLSFYGIVPQMQTELTVWMSVYWSYYLVSVGMCEITAFEVNYINEKYLHANKLLSILGQEDGVPAV